ncbi:MAG TPA: hypothetical protein VHF58_01320, partial [Solirubrobacterales bacterium]|nr:hypothetical protein [Solirubrobacterales bacterium]
AQGAAHELVAGAGVDRLATFAEPPHARLVRDAFTNVNFVANQSSVRGFGEGSKTIHAGPGDQFVGGALSDDVLRGEDGDDTIHDGSGFGCCILLRGGGGGIPTGPAGNDVLDGGPGRDGTSYSRTAPLTITLDGLPNDGEAGEADNVQVEDVFTGDGDDVVIGNDAANALGGGAGNDRLVGSGGDDELFGDFGTTLLVDSIASRKGGPISDAHGNDTLDGGAGRDGLDCGRGIDVALRRPGDAVHINCERIGAEIADDNSRVKGLRKGSDVKRKKRGKFKVRLECDPDEGAGCVGKLKIESDGKKIGKGRFNVAAGKTKNGKAKLNKRGLRKVRKAGGSLVVTVTATTSEPGGFAKDRDRIQLHR